MVLLPALTLPLSPNIQRHVVKICDNFLFSHPHPSLNISLFWIIINISGLTLFTQYRKMTRARALFQHVKLKGGNKKDSLIRLLAAQRNVWMAASGFFAWIFLHRYRSLLKKYLESLEKNNEREYEATPINESPVNETSNRSS